MTSSLDDRLLSALRRNARLSTSELARQLDVSRATVQNRIRKLEDAGIIEGYTVRLGQSWRDKRIRAHVLVEVEQKRSAEVTRRLEQLDSVAALYVISGNYDLILELEVDSTGALSRQLDDIGLLTGVLRTTSSVILETRVRQ
ncbi:AsnC family transcriptional regulator [Oceanococcus atlanticus]|uniref:AsnC family transcriptional regulator n=1 Tax=Oceanococcus atlanticus TaxID=1317117 RepID=A0A1Y1SF32_9GAMM|nr:Lrp/AsnC family transcriptional regulator [Oceanococcus atlanticus]ORE87303.1 AsnC family transcriptional regulator [Oceanococcus atlanticus]